MHTVFKVYDDYIANLTVSALNTRNLAKAMADDLENVVETIPEYVWCGVVWRSLVCGIVRGVRCLWGMVLRSVEF